MQNFGLTIYPLSNQFKQELNELVSAELEYNSVSELRQGSWLKLLKRLRNIRGNLYIPIEDERSLAILPILHIMANLTRAKARYLVNKDFKIQPSKLRHLVKYGVKFLFAGVSARKTLTKLSSELTKLESQAQITVPKTNLQSGSLLYVNANLWFGVKAGGSIGHVAGVVNAYLARGLKLCYAAFDQNPMLDAKAEFIQLTLPGSFTVPYELNYYQAHQAMQQQLAPQMQTCKVIYQRLSIGNYVGVSLSRKYKVPLIVEYNGSETWVAENWGKGLRYAKQAKQAENVMLQHAHAIVTVSKVLQAELIAKGIAPEKIIVYPNCVDPDYFNNQRFTQQECTQLRAKYNIPEDTILFTFLGTFGQWHGVDVLAKAICILMDADPQWFSDNKVHFLWVGDGALMAEVQVYLKHKRFHNYVSFAGLIPQAQAPLYLAASDVFLSPHVANRDGTKFFGSPTKLFEYMSMGKLIIASKLEQLAEVLQPSIDLTTNQQQQLDSAVAILTKPGSAHELAEAIRYSATNYKNLVNLGSNARAKVLKEYGWQQHVETIISHCKQMDLFENYEGINNRN